MHRTPAVLIHQSLLGHHPGAGDLQQASQSLLMIAVKRGDRVAQLILERILTPEVEEVSELDITVRGSGGYGSTGVSR